jgi:acetyl-CoA carboxylase biotin carboxyl carrier protein
MMDLRKLKKLIDLVQESGIAELEITEGEERVRIVKGAGEPARELTYLASPQPSLAPAEPAPQLVASNQPPDGHVVKSPKWYVLPVALLAARRLHVGDAVRRSDLCIIEAIG